MGIRGILRRLIHWLKIRIRFVWIHGKRVGSDEWSCLIIFIRHLENRVHLFEDKHSGKIYRLKIISVLPINWM